MRREDESFKNLYPFESNYLQLDSGARMHYLDEGSDNKEILVMLHGNPSWSFYYRRLIEAFREKYRVIVPDHIGMGFSEKPQKYCYTLGQHIQNLTELLDSITTKEEKVTLLVHDWGGAIGMGWATEHVEQIEKLIIFNTGAFLSTKIPFRINICRMPIFGSLAIRGFNAFAGAATTMAVTKPMTEDVKAGFILPYNNWQNRVATLRFVQDIPLAPNETSYNTLEAIDNKLALLKSKKMLILWGGKDWCFHDDFYAEWKDRFPDATTKYYSEGGHYVIEDEHEDIIPRVEEFLKN